MRKNRTRTSWLVVGLICALLSAPPVGAATEDPEASPKQKNADRVLEEMKTELGRYHEKTEANQRQLFEEVQRAADDRRRSRRGSKIIYSCVFAMVSAGIIGAFIQGGGEHPLAERISVERKLIAYDQRQATDATLLLAKKITVFENADGSFNDDLLPALTVMGAVVRTELATDDGKGKIPNGLWRVMFEGDTDGEVSEAARNLGIGDGELVGDSFGQIRDFLKRADENEMADFDQVFAVALANLLRQSRSLSRGLDGDRAGGIFTEMTLGTFVYQEVMPLARLGAGASLQDGERFRIDPP